MRAGGGGTARPLPPPLGARLPVSLSGLSACLVRAWPRPLPALSTRPGAPRPVLHLRAGPCVRPAALTRQGRPGEGNPRTESLWGVGLAGRYEQGRGVRAGAAGSVGECWLWAEGRELERLSVCSRVCRSAPTPELRDVRGLSPAWLRFRAGEDRGQRAAWPKRGSGAPGARSCQQRSSRLAPASRAAPGHITCAAGNRAGFKPQTRAGATGLHGEQARRAGHVGTAVGQPREE